MCGRSVRPTSFGIGSEADPGIRLEGPVSGRPQPLDVDFVRGRFPALTGPFVFFDNGGGSQILQPVVDRLNDFLVRHNVQLGASYPLSVEAGRLLSDAQRAVATLINASDPDEVVMGPSTTALLRMIASSIGRTLQAGDEIVITTGDHEANIGPWLELEAMGARVRWWRPNPETGVLDPTDLEPLLNERTGLVAMTHTSNVLGSIHPVADVADMVHGVGALLCVDGVAFAPHRAVDVQTLGADLYAFSFYKTFGPHHAVLWGRRELLQELPGHGFVFVSEDDVPYKFQPGNVNYELSVSLLGILDYFGELDADQEGARPMGAAVPRSAVVSAYERIAVHEEKLVRPLLEMLSAREGVRIIGHDIADRDARVSIVSFVSSRRSSREIVTAVDAHGIGIRHGSFYSSRLLDELGIDAGDGVVRVSMVHYNTSAEVDRLITVLDPLI